MTESLVPLCFPGLLEIGLLIKNEDNRARGAALAKLRVSAGLNKSEAARRSGIDRAVIGKLESGERRPLLDHLRGLARAYGFRMETVLMFAGYLELPGFEELRLSEEPVEQLLDAILTQTTISEKRDLAKYLAAMRMVSPMVDDMLAS